MISLLLVANAILIPYILEAYGKKIHNKLKELAIAAGICHSNVPEKNAAELFIKSIRELNAKMNIGTKIPDIKKQDIEKLSYYADKEGNPVYPVPVLMDQNELKQFYYNLI